MSSSFPFTIEDFETPNGRKLIMLEPGEWVLFPEFKDELERLYKFEVRPDDIWLLGIPKSGNTWATEMIWTVYYDADIEKAKQTSHFDRWCFPEMRCYRDSNNIVGCKSEGFQRDYYKEAVEAKSPRFIRTHLPLALLPQNLLNTAKVVYIYRNPKDVIVSGMSMMQGTSREFRRENEDPDFSLLASGVCSDLPPMSPWLQHIKAAWKERNHPNMLFISYEEMKRDLPKALRRTAKFLDKSLTDDQINKLQDHLSVDSMRKNKSINMNEFKEMGLLGKQAEFIRKGTVGDWKNYFTPELEDMWTQWLEKHLAGTDISFNE